MSKKDKETLHHLQYAFGLVNDWLRFGDAKLATALAFNGLALSVTVGVVTGDAAGDWPTFVRSWLFWAGGGFALAAIKALFTLNPIVNSRKLKVAESASSNNDRSSNPYFFGHTESLSVDELIEAIDRSPRRDIAKQIIINSQITRRKYRGFTWVATIDIIAVFPPYLLWVCGAGFVRLICRGGTKD